METAKSRLMSLPRLGAGIIYTPALLQMDIPEGLLDTLEIEPQTLCIRDERDHLKIPEEVFQEIKALNYHKLVHSIGAPVGGSVLPADDQVGLINYSAALFDSPWITEHLSFNATTEFNTGFFLPPCQTEEGLALAVRNIRHLQEKTGRPIAVETGVNYLRPGKGEMNDGAFVAGICEQTGCGILLDIHNLFANQLNGRQRIEEFMNEIPLENVVELHIAGGTELNELWLDSHSGPIDHRLLALTRALLPELTSLKAITYEIFDSYIPVVGDKVILNELEKVRDLWDNRERTFQVTFEDRMPEPVRQMEELNRNYEPAEWEQMLGSLVIGRETENGMQVDDRIEVYQKLIREFRASMVARIFKLTTRYLMLVTGMEVFSVILHDFWKKYPPEQLSYKEAKNFAAYLENKNYTLPWLNRLLRYEVAVLDTLMDERPRVVSFEADPTPMFNALSDGRLPEQAGSLGNYEVEITPETHKTEWVVF